MGARQSARARGAFSGRGGGATWRRGSAMVASLVVVAAMLAGGVALTLQLAASAGRHRLTVAESAEAGMTPFESLNVALGPFRGLIINMLWVRANDLQLQGRLFEVNELARAILKMQPRMSRVWVFHAWNMAYNISVTTNSPQERWGWVKKGIDLLRQEGLRANPNDLLLHRELAWIFLHKIQGMTDDANPQYKRYLAAEWQAVLGPPPMRDWLNQTRQQAVEAYVEWLRPIAEGASTAEELYARAPRARGMVQELRAQAGIDLETREGRAMFLRGVTRLEERRAWGRSANVRLLAEDEQASAFARGVVGSMVINNPIDRALLEILLPMAVRGRGEGDAEIDAARAELVRHVRKRTLAEDYRMDIGRMIEYGRTYGPLDFRHPAAHTLYWATRGAELALKRVQASNERDFDFINSDRNIVHAVQELYRNGTLMYSLLMPDMYVTMPNPDWIPVYRQVIAALHEREMRQNRVQRGADITGAAWNFYATGYENFMADAIAFLYRRGQVDEAKRLQIQLAGEIFLNRNDYERQAIREAPLEQFIAHQLEDRVSSPSIAIPEISGALQSAFFDGLLNGRTELFRRQYEYARLVHTAFFSEQNMATVAVDTLTRLEFFDRDFVMLAGQQLAYWLIGMQQTVQDPLAPNVGLGQAMVMFRRAGIDPDLQAAAYLFMEMQFLHQEADAATRASFQTAFPRPARYEAIRSRYLQRVEEARRLQAERARPTQN